MLSSVPEPLKDGNSRSGPTNGYEASLVPRWFLITALIGRLV